MIRSYKDLEVYKRSFKMAVFWVTRNFPEKEIYALTSQFTRSSRSVSANVCEPWTTCKYESAFKQHLIHALGSCSETETWLDFALECKYIDQPTHKNFADEFDQIGKMLNKLHQNWKSHGK